jgi:thiol-disulfide isomerase/thioredoxin
MKVWLAALGAVILLAAPLAAQSYAAFGAQRPADFSAPAWSDQDITGLLGTLDQILGSAPAGSAWRETAADALAQFARRTQSARLSKAQETRVLAHLDRLGRSRPEAAALVTGPRRIVSALSVGKPAPEVVGRDLEGRQFKLSDYRNKVVLLVFTADWCAICKAQAPYERFLLDKYARWPFAILAVETGSSREVARQAQAASPLSHRAWWDEPRPGVNGGPISAAWNVTGWPASYLIDGDGIIQFVDVREEPLLIAVRQLVESQADRKPYPDRSKK